MTLLTHNRNSNRLLIVTTIGATHRAFLLPFAKYFRQKGWKVDGLAAGISEIAECKEAYDNVFDFPFNRKPTELLSSLLGLRKLRRLVVRENYDVVHVHTPIAAFLTRFALKSLPHAVRPKIVYTAHGFHFYKGANFFQWGYLFGEKLASFWSDFLIVINQEDFDAARLFKLAPKIMYMPGIGVDLSIYKPSSNEIKERLRRELEISRENKCILMVAEFIARKRHIDLIEAIRYLGDENIKILFAGQGPLLAKLKAYVENLGLGDQFRFLGFRNDISHLMSISHLNVLPSLHEGLPSMTTVFTN